MKNILLVFLAFCLLLSFAGCSLPEVERNQNTTVAATVETEIPTTEETIEVFEQKPMIAVSLPVVEQEETSEDGTVIFRYSYRNMSLIVPDPEVADKVILDYLNRIDHTTVLAQQISEAAKTAYSGNSQWTPYLCQIGYDPMRIDAGILSLFGSYTEYSGTPHPEKSYLSINYDLLTGNVLNLDDILTADFATDTLYQYVIDILSAQKDENNLYNGFETIVQERFHSEQASDMCWYFSQTGLCFYFSPYEIAPYASGVITAEIPYEKLTGILNDAYFPSEFECGSNDILQETFNENALDKFTQFSEVILDDSGNKILLYTEGVISHIQIEVGYWNTDNTEFTPEYTVFSAYSLTPGDAIMVESKATKKMPNLRLSYNTLDGTERYYIDFDIEFGNPVLVEE